MNSEQRVHDGGGLWVAGFGVDVAVDHEPGADSVEVAEGGFEDGERGGAVRSVAPLGWSLRSDSGSGSVPNRTAEPCYVNPSHRGPLPIRCPSPWALVRIEASHLAGDVRPHADLLAGIENIEQ